MNKTLKTLGAIVLATTLTTGCAKKDNNSIQRNPYSTESDTSTEISGSKGYIILRQSGGVITDVYKISYDDLRSIGSNYVVITTGDKRQRSDINGDMKVISTTIDSDLWNKYVNYHMEFEKKSYSAVRDSLLHK